MENKKEKISTPMAIIIAGFLIMIGFLLTNNKTPSTPKTLSEQVGVSKTDLAACIKATDMNALSKKISDSLDKAISTIPQDQRGTPFTIVVGPNNFKAQILGYVPLEQLQEIITQARVGKLATTQSSSTDKNGKTVQSVSKLDDIYTGQVQVSEDGDHIAGNPNGDVTIIEYADFECPYCKMFNPVLQQITSAPGNNVKWIYRNFPVHQNSYAKLTAAECIAKLKGNDAYWKYSDLLFKMLKTSQDSADSLTDQL